MPIPVTKIEAMTTFTKLVESVECHPVPAPDPLPVDMPYVTHEGVLNLGSCRIDVCVLSNGQRVLTGEFVDSLMEQFKCQPSGFAATP